MSETAVMPEDAPPPLPGRWMTRRYLLGLAVVAALLCAAVVLFHLLIAQNAARLDLVNASGRQRMLAQQSTLYALRLATESDAAARTDARAALDGTVAQLVEDHRRLRRRAGNLSPTLRALYLEGPASVTALVEAQAADLLSLLEAPPTGVADPRLRRVMTRGGGPLLDALDRAVAAVQAHGEAEARRLQILVVAVIAGILLVLVVEALVLFRPMVRQADRQMRAQMALSADLRRARDGLEAEVARRTRDLAQARDAAERASAAKSRFLATVGHDLLQPVKALGVFVTSLERSRLAQEDPAMAAATPDPRDTLVDLRGALASMSGLIKGLLDFSRSEHGQLRAAPRPVPLAPLLGQLEAEFAPLGARQGLRLRVVRCAALVDSDPVLLERILRNLIGNALRYTARGGVVVGCRRRGRMVRLEVHDSGPGIAEADQARVREAFVRGADAPAAADSHEALGLGLAIVTELAAVLGHRTGMASREGRGSVFWVEMPLAGASGAGAKAGRPISAGSTPTA